MTKRYKFGYIERFGRSEYETIEHRVYHIANGTRGNQRHHIDIQQAMGSGLDDVALVELEFHFTGYIFLGLLDESLLSLTERSEPFAFVYQACELCTHFLLECISITV